MVKIRVYCTNLLTMDKGFISYDISSNIYKQGKSVIDEHLNEIAKKLNRAYKYNYYRLEEKT